MFENLVIIGAGGHGKVVADVAIHAKKYKNVIFLDDDENLKEVLGIPVLGKSADAMEYIEKADLFVAIGNANRRKEIQDFLDKKGAVFAKLIHPDAVIGKNVCIGAGTVIMAGVVVNVDTRIGKGCIINTSSSVDHDCCLADFTHISIGVHIAGSVKIDEFTWIGAGAVVSNNINIGSSCMIGAGAVVVNDIRETGTYIGIPAKKMGINKMKKEELSGGDLAERLHGW